MDKETWQKQRDEINAEAQRKADAYFPSQFKPMIAANELRIGNWFKWAREHVNYGQILSITRNGTFYDVKYNCKDYLLIGGYTGVYISDLEPIPLTPEVLEKAGFEGRETNSMRIKLISDQILSFSSRYPSSLPFSINDSLGNMWSFRLCVKYVHQLQNLYYTLTGTELTIEL